jgi:hypothetical protein
VIAPHARRAGLGGRLLARACDQLRAAGAPLIVAEVHDPAHAPDAEEARRRLAFFERRGARALDLRYVQPDLGAGLGRDRDLLLIAFFAGPPPFVDGARVRAFLREFYDVVEGRERSSDPEVTAMLAAIPDRIGYFFTVVA